MRNKLYNLIILINSIFILVTCREEFSDVYVTPAEYHQTEYEIISPRYADNWDVGSVNTIQWTPPYGLDNVKILLYKKTEFIQIVAPRVENSGKYTWIIPDLPYRSHHYILRIVNPSSGETVIESPHFFVLR